MSIVCTLAVVSIVCTLAVLSMVQKNLVLNQATYQADGVFDEMDLNGDGLLGRKDFEVAMRNGIGSIKHMKPVSSALPSIDSPQEYGISR